MARYFGEKIENAAPDEIRVRTTEIVSDRLAKIATTFTDGKCVIVYGGLRAMTDVRGRIYLPAETRDFAVGQRRGRSEEEWRLLEKLTWAYVNHEMGHQRVEIDLKKSRRGKLNPNMNIINLIPPDLRDLAVQPGAQVMSMTDWMEDQPRVARELALRLPGKSDAVLSQLHAFINGVEDPRMERFVGSMWPGAKVHLRDGIEIMADRWRKQVEEAKAQGHYQDGGFKMLSIAVCFEVHGVDTAFFGPKTMAQVNALRDIIDVYRGELDTSPQGFFDAVNTGIALLARVYRQEIPIDQEDAPVCPKCGSEKVIVLRVKDKFIVRCFDCGWQEEIEPERDEEAGSDESQDEQDGEQEGEESDPGGESQEGPGGGSEPSEEQDEDDGVPGSEEDDDGDDTPSGDPGDAEEEPGDSEDGASGEDDPSDRDDDGCDSSESGSDADDPSEDSEADDGEDEGPQEPDEGDGEVDPAEDEDDADSGGGDAAEDAEEPPSDEDGREGDEDEPDDEKWRSNKNRPDIDGEDDGADDAESGDDPSQGSNSDDVEIAVGMLVKVKSMGIYGRVVAIRETGELEIAPVSAAEVRGKIP